MEIVFRDGFRAGNKGGGGEGNGAIGGIAIYGDSDYFYKLS